MKYKVGDRVKISIIDSSNYAKGAYESLQSLKGEIEEVKDMSNWTRIAYKDLKKIQPMYLVRFEKPPKAWWTHQRPSSAFHFPESDLIHDREKQDETEN